MTNLTEQLETQYDEVQTLKLENTDNPPDLTVGETVTIRRNKHNGQTTDIKIRALAQQNQELIIAGNHTQ